MKVFAFYDFGLSAKPQCVVDAEDVETAREIAATKGFHIHRLTAKLGVRVMAFYEKAGWIMTSGFDTRQGALQGFRDFPAQATPLQICYAFAGNPLAYTRDEECLKEPIEDLAAEYAKHGL